MGLVGAIVVRPTVVGQAALWRHERELCGHRLRPRVPAAAHRDGPRHPPAGGAGQPEPRHLRLLCGAVVHQRPQRHGHAVRRTTSPGCRPSPTARSCWRKPGEKILLRLVNAGRDAHPFHLHGNNITVIARDGRLLESAPGASGPDLAWSDFTIKAVPGATYDGIFTWTGKYLGWDMYGRAGNSTYRNQTTHLPTASYPAGSTQDDSRPMQTAPGDAAQRAGRDLRHVLQRQPLPGHDRHAATRGRANGTRMRATSTCGTRTARRSSSTTTSSRAAC